MENNPLRPADLQVYLEIDPFRYCFIYMAAYAWAIYTAFDILLFLNTDENARALGSTCSKSDFRFKLQGIVPRGECAQHCALKVVNHQNTLRLSIPDFCQVPLSDAPYDLMWYALSYRTAASSQQGLPEHDLCVCQMSLRMQRQRRFSVQPTAKDCSKEAVGERLAIGDWSLLDAQYVPPSKHVNISMQPSNETETCRSWDPLEEVEGPALTVNYNRTSESA